MAVSLNGWSFITSALDPRLRTITVPGTTKRITARRVVTPLLAAALNDVHRTVISIEERQQCTAAWNARKTASGNLSDHGSGTAVDIRWDVFKADGQRHMTDEQRAAMNRILDRYTVTHKGKRVFGWGGNFRRTQDEMHLSIGQAWEQGVGSAVTRADVVAVKKRLGIDRNGVRRNKADGTPRRRKDT